MNTASDYWHFRRTGGIREAQKRLTVCNGWSEACKRIEGEGSREPVVPEPTLPLCLPGRPGRNEDYGVGLGQQTGLEDAALVLRKKTILTLTLASVCGLALMQAAEPGTTQINPDGLELFEKRIRPVLLENCLTCHGSEQAMAGLRLDFRGGWEKGGQSGPAIVPGQPDLSPLIRAIRHDGSQAAMPLGGSKLGASVISAFEQWVSRGAPDPRDAPAVAPAVEQSWEEIYQERSRWWSLQPVVRPPMPDVKHEEWSDHPVDRFILAKLEEEGLRSAPGADRNTLLRRLSFVLTGLPPRAEEVEAFAGDQDAGAYARVVDRLLASPHFGERWARHWMDVVRYTDTYGYEWDIPAKGAWRFRDYLIRAFNADIPFDQLLREQIAGDLLAHPRINTSEQVNESLIGPMFYQMGEKRHGDSVVFNGIYQEMLDNKIDAFSKAFQAMTVACARCHNHKLDAISQKDYYALGGVFLSSRWVVNTVDTPDRNRKVLDELLALKAKLRAPLAAWWLEGARDIPLYLRAAQARIDGDGKAGELARGLDPVRLTAWEELLRFEPEAEPAEADEKPSKDEEPSETAESAPEEDQQPTLEDPLFPWFEVHRSALKEGGSVKGTWAKLAQDYSGTRRERSHSNAQEFSLLADFRRGVPEGWSVDGVGLRDGPVSNGDFTVALEGQAAVGMLLPAGLFTHSLSPRLNGALRSPYLNFFSQPYINLEVAGGDYSTRRLLADNAFLTEREYAYLKQDNLHWVCHTTTGADKSARARTEEEMAEVRTFVELTTKASNPYFPPRVGLGGCTKEKVREDSCGAQDPRSWFGITQAFLAKQGDITDYGKAQECLDSPADELTRFDSLFAGDAPADLPSVASRYKHWLTASLEAWAQDRADEDDVLLINWMLDSGLLPNNVDDRELIRDLVLSYRAAEKQLAEPQTVNGMADLDPGRDYRLNIRGVYEDLGEQVPRGYVEVIAGRREEGPRPAGSGRLELAEIIASPNNPLTARVFVNRVWHWVFGTGIVKTANDFGHLGDRPSHPELLDYLAGRFIEDGWSVKKLVRMLVTSETFQQSGRFSAAAREADPRNRLLHHYPLRRLDAEAIRDSLLAVSGRLDRRLFGPPINPYRSSEDAAKWLLSGPLDGQGRRSVYLKMTIMEPPKFLSTFNQPNPKIPTGARDVTNVPGQALALLNDPFAVGQAEFWARQLIATSHESPEQRLGVMFQRAFGRDPDEQERTRWISAVHDIAGLYQDIPEKTSPPGGLMDSLDVWKDMAHAMFNAKEFLYVQ